MTDLSAFLLARIAEDEEANRPGPEPEAWCDRGEGVHYGRERVAAECDAKRRIVSEHRHTMETRGCDCSEHGDLISYMDCDTCVGSIGYADTGGWCLTLRALALPYADHPDCQPEWKL